MQGNIVTNMNLATWIILGVVAGIIANIIDPRPVQGGLIGAVILGVVGALVGGFFSNLIFGIDVIGFNLTSLAVAVLGSLLLLFIGRAVRRS